MSYKSLNVKERIFARVRTLQRKLHDVRLANDKYAARPTDDEVVGYLLDMLAKRHYHHTAKVVVPEGGNYRDTILNLLNKRRK